jgi:uncharacterized protein
MTTTPAAEPTITGFVLKLASRCNLACSYCYWFEDEAVLRHPRLLGDEVRDALIVRLEGYVTRKHVTSLSVILHGGEPLLYGKKKTRELLRLLRALEERTGCELRISVTTNGVLIDQEWAAIFKGARCFVAVSVDGPPEIHDRARVDFAGRGSHARVARAARLLAQTGTPAGALAVCDPTSDPVAVAEHIVKDLGFRSFEVLIPDATHDDAAPRSLASFYAGLFDYVTGSDIALRVRVVDNLVRLALGRRSRSQDIGWSPMTGATVLTDGSLQPEDQLRAIGTDDPLATGLNVLHDDIEALHDNPLWREIYEASITRPTACRGCDYVDSCGGGALQNRWSVPRRFDNKNVYCDDMKAVFAHVGASIANSLYLAEQ